MKKLFIIGILAMTAVSTFTSCKKYLDINSDPDTPQFPDASSVFPTQLSGIPRGLQYDSRYVGRYVQNWLSANTATAANVNFDRMGYTSASDAAGDIWRQVYYGLGKNLDYIIDQGKAKQQWDYVGAAYTLKAMMFQYATDYHGEIVFKDAFKENAVFFRYDEQEAVYKGVDSLCRLAIDYLGRTDLSPSASKLAKGDFVYSGNTARWMKFTYGILARNFHRTTNKSTYNADSVIYYCDKSLVDVNDDFLIPFDASKNDDTNFYGTYRDNLTLFRQSNFIVKLLDGTVFSGVAPSAATAFNRDPRMKHMLSASQDTTNGNGGFRGVDPGLGDPNASGTKRVAALWGDSIYTNPSSAVFSSLYKRYLFGDKVVFPVMTASEIQFTKAEAAFRKGDKNTALAAYTKGINLHFDFINRSTFPRGNQTLFNTNPISATERTNYLNGNDVKRSTATLTLSDIMLQKYIALWGWGFFETWVDLRRYHYTDIDPTTGLQVYNGFALPSTLAPENLGKPVYRVRPRYNSEYIWNRDELLRIGALNGDYHTYEMWFSQP
ncbi:MAG: hypothetical protein JWQ27_2223 [Ferruginibacter sp.]|nr:hypothetical protein [Ferruginibacter sp.]